MEIIEDDKNTLIVRLTRKEFSKIENLLEWDGNT
jgi:hypothetical protein